MASFQYATSGGGVKDFEAADSAAALAALKGFGDVAPHSGVISNPPGVGTPVGDTTDAPVTGSSGSSRKKEQNLGATIEEMYSGKSPVFDTSYLDSLDKLLKQNLNYQEGSINADFAGQYGDLTKAQKGEMGSTSAQVARAGGYLGYSGSGQGVVNNLAAEHRAELAKLESLRQKELQLARDGYAKGAMAVAQQRTELAKQYEQQAYDRKIKFFDQTQKLINEQNISDAIAAGAKSPQSIFNKLGGKVSIEDINSYLDAANPVTGGAFKFSSSDMAHLLGAGFTQDDIASVGDYVNQYGYTDEFRSKLSARERQVLDSIYYPKTAGPGTVGGSLSLSEAKSLGLPLSLIGRSEQQVLQDLQSNTPPVWYIQYVQNKDMIDYTDEALISMWTGFRNSVLSGGKGGGSSSLGGGSGASTDISFEDTVSS